MDDSTSFYHRHRWQSVLDNGRCGGFFPGLDEVRYMPGGVPQTPHDSTQKHHFSSIFSNAEGSHQGVYDSNANTLFRPRSDSAGSTGTVSRRLATLTIDKVVGRPLHDTGELPGHERQSGGVETTPPPWRQDYWSSMVVTDVSEPEDGSGLGDILRQDTERAPAGSISCLTPAAVGSAEAPVPAVRSHHRRKPAKPTKSPARFDPAFKGVTFQIETLPQQTPALRIRSYFSIRRRCQAARQRRFSESDATWFRRRSGSLTETTSGSEHEDSHCTGHSHGAKQCASCDTKKTPLWRDAEDGTPLCNACGIRYKKYRVRCTRCWHVPKKDGKSYPNCGRCGDLLRVSIFRRYSI